MASVKKLFKNVVGKLIFREVGVTSNRAVAPGFQRIELEGESLKNALWKAGDKVQVMLDAGARTYTPFAFDGARGVMNILVFAHGDSPGSAWGKTATPGERAFVFGPRSSLAFDGVPGPAVLFGDETSFAAALTLRELRASASVQCVFEVSDRAAAQTVLAHLGLAADNVSLIERAPSGAHLDAVEYALRAALQARPAATLVLTGAAPSIQSLRGRLKAAQVPHAKPLSKAYWAPGKRGLD